MTDEELVIWEQLAKWLEECKKLKEAIKKIKDELERYRIIGDGIYDGTVDFAIAVIDKYTEGLV